MYIVLLLIFIVLLLRTLDTASASAEAILVEAVEGLK